MPQLLVSVMLLIRTADIYAVTLVTILHERIRFFGQNHLSRLSIIAVMLCLNNMKTSTLIRITKITRPIVDINMWEFWRCLHLLFLLSCIQVCATHLYVMMLNVILELRQSTLSCSLVNHCSVNTSYPQ